MIVARLQKRKEQHLYRERWLRTSPMTAQIILNNTPVYNFSSNNYLGLANHPRVIQAAKSAMDAYGVGAGSASLLGGHHRCHQALEEALADFLGRQRVLLFNSGYAANIGLLSAFLKRDDAVFADRLVHASLIDGIRLSGANLTRYPHLDMRRLSQKLQQSAHKNKIIVTESVFSMDGDVIPLDTLTQLAKQQHATIIIDDAHGFGVIGGSGRGILDTCVGDQPRYVISTLGKALGCHGGFVSGSKFDIDYLVQFARSYIYTTAMPPAVAAAALAALTVMQEESWRRALLRKNIQYFKQCARAFSLPFLDSETPIQPLMVGDPLKAIRLAQALFKRGYYVSAIRPPSVSPKQSRLRISISVEQDTDHMEELLSHLAQLLSSQAF